MVVVGVVVGEHLRISVVRRKAALAVQELLSFVTK